MPKGIHRCLSFSKSLKWAMPFVIIIRLVATYALAIIAIAAAAMMQTRALLAEMFVDPE
jgi:hypothetical protein